MLKGAPTGAQKNIPAAKKMVYPAVGGTPMGRGKGRGICLWVTLVILSQAMYLTRGLLTPQEKLREGINPKETKQKTTWSQNTDLRVCLNCSKGGGGKTNNYNNGSQINNCNICAKVNSCYQIIKSKCSLYNYEC